MSIGETNDRWWRCNRDKYGRRKKYITFYVISFLFLLLCTMVYLSFEDVFSYLEAVSSSQCVGKGPRVLKSVTRVVLFALCLKT
jgi:hypothetical protein